jgi:hypothetical protein
MSDWKFLFIFKFKSINNLCHFCLNCAVMSKVRIPIAIFLRRGAERSDKIVEVIKKNTRFQYERSLAARSVAERSDIYRVDQERFISQIAAKTLAEMT